MWVYSQSTGQLFHTDLDLNYLMWVYSQSTQQLMRYNPEAKLRNAISVGYSGCDDHPPILGRNNPDAQEIPDLGPIPRGLYYIGSFLLDPKLGPLAARLVPDHTTNTFGRSGFFIHGDNLHHDASHGCIVLDHATRFHIDYACCTNNDEKVLLVVE